MGLYLKALVVTLLLMEITTLVALTAVWAILSELHVTSHIITLALVLCGVLLIVPAVAVYRRAIRAERAMATEDTAHPPADPLPAPDPSSPPNLAGRARPNTTLTMSGHPSRHTRPSREI